MIYKDLQIDSNDEEAAQSILDLLDVRAYIGTLYSDGGDKEHSDDEL